jgi:redox-sensitive bicupin YhaK (pirin superfamily)
MGITRKIRRVIRSQPTLEGAGVHLKRVFGFGDTAMFDPFLLLDDFRNDVPAHYLKGFPWHPHRGIETITYMLRGEVAHGDSMGNAGVIGAGDVQWMTAGSGIIHQEMPQGDHEGAMWGFQLWANLPAARKMMAPRYQEIGRSSIPEVVTPDGVTIRVVCGRVEETVGPVTEIVIEPQLFDIALPPRGTYTLQTRQGHTALAFVFEGRGFFCPEKNPFTYEMVGRNYFDLQRPPYVENGTLVVFHDGDEIFVSTEEQGVRFLFISGRPIGEPVAWYGPIVMNTQEELQVAFEEYNNGTFIKHGNGN